MKRLLIILTLIVTLMPAYADDIAVYRLNVENFRELTRSEERRGGKEC